MALFPPRVDTRILVYGSNHSRAKMMETVWMFLKAIQSYALIKTKGYNPGREMVLLEIEYHYQAMSNNGNYHYYQSMQYTYLTKLSPMQRNYQFRRYLGLVYSPIMKIVPQYNKTVLTLIAQVIVESRMESYMDVRRLAITQITEHTPKDYQTRWEC